MPRDQAGALDAPQPLSAFIQHAAREKLGRRKDRARHQARRRVTQHRLESAEHVLRSIVAGADFIGESAEPQRVYSDATCFGPLVFLFVALPRYSFRDLCELGASLEDTEESGDAEPGSDEEETVEDQGELTLGWEGIDQSGRRDSEDRELDCADDEPGVDDESTLVAPCGASLNVGNISDEEVLLPGRRA